MHACFKYNDSDLYVYSYVNVCMHVYMYVCMYACSCIHMHIAMYLVLYACIWLWYICICVLCVHVCTCFDFWLYKILVLQLSCPTKFYKPLNIIKYNKSIRQNLYYIWDTFCLLLVMISLQYKNLLPITAQYTSFYLTAEWSFP